MSAPFAVGPGTVNWFGFETDSLVPHGLRASCHGPARGQGRGQGTGDAVSTRHAHHSTGGHVQEQPTWAQGTHTGTRAHCTARAPGLPGRVFSFLKDCRKFFLACLAGAALVARSIFLKNY